jgi:TonB-linked SusC/RagA family outer membrane protein
MQKKPRLFAIGRQNLTKFLLRMKLVTVLILIASLQLSAKTYSQQRITLKLESAELKAALKQIEKKSIYRFLYNNDVLNSSQKVSIDANNELVTAVLDNVFNTSLLTYRILENNLVVITQKNVVPPSQDIKVTGRVTSTTGEGVPGVTVKIKGSSVATSTDAGGSYSLSVPDGARLVFSSVGYLTQEVAVNSRTEINVVMQIAAKDINEVVVIGYGSASKRDLTGSITKVAGKEIADKPNTNPVASLQGKVAGLSVVNNGTPGKAPDIRIRGTSSIGQSQPLYVVDGIFNDNIDYLNPNDIESIEILKDPSSLAIFGVRGATGVIAITTKRAKPGQLVVNFNTTYGTKKLVNKIKFVDAAGFKTLFAEERANNGDTSSYDYTGLTANTDWIDAVTRTGHFNTNNLSVSTSTEKNKFNMGMGYVSDEGIVKNEKLSKILLSFSDEVKLTKNIKLGINFNASRQNNPYDATNVLNDARKVSPIFSADTKPFRIKNPYTPSGSDSINVDLYSGLDVGLQNNGVVNPLVRLQNEWNKVINIEYRNVGSVFAEVNFLKHFNFKTTFYADISNVNKRQFTPLYDSYDPRTGKEQAVTRTTTIEENDESYKKFQQDYILNYKGNFGDHGLTVLGGFTTYYSGAFKRTGKASQFNASIPTSIPIPDNKRFWYLSNGFTDPTTQNATSEQYENTTASLLARALYNYKGKYYLNASFRDDASSRIIGANQHQKFWAVGAAWEISKEDFFQKQDFIDYLKIKASTGVLGNQSAYKNNEPGSPLNYPYYPKLNLVRTTFGSTVYNAATPEYIPNANLKWETVAAQEVGIELDAFKRRLHFEANYFNKITNDLMTYVDRQPIGLANELVNGGKLRNRGVELSANWNQKVLNDFNVSIGGNITFLKNKVISLSDELPTGVLFRASENNGSAESRTQPGDPIGSFYGYVVDGIWQSNTEILRSTLINELDAIHPGDFKFKDVNGDGYLNAKDRTIIGNPTPDFIYGINLNLSYKGFNLGVEMGGVYGNEVFRKWGSLESPFQRVNYAAEKLDRWHGAGTSNWTPIINSGNRVNYNGSTYNIEDGSYFRLRNIQLGYNLSSNVISKLKIKNVRLFANMQNPVTWKHNLGYTAEFGGDATSFGYDGGGGAIPAVTTFGLNVTF